MYIPMGWCLSNSNHLIFKLLVSNGDLEIYSDLSGSHTIQLYSVDEIVHKLPDKYAGSAKPDWEQNDETAPDYVKNRPFYTSDDLVETEIMPTTTVSFIAAGAGGIMGAYCPKNFDEVEGRTYKITWDGTDYVCTCKLSDQGPVIGNLGIFGLGDDTGEPFIFDNPQSCLIYSTDPATEHVIAISEYVPQIVTIDPKFLPSSKEFVVDATNIPDWAPNWEKLWTALEDAYNSGYDIFLDVYGNGELKLKLLSKTDTDYLFLYCKEDFTIHVYILKNYSDDYRGLKKFSLTATEVTE